MDKKKKDALAEREAKETGDEKKRREKTLKESKKIVLEEDGTLPKPTKVCFYVVPLKSSAHSEFYQKARPLQVGTSSSSITGGLAGPLLVLKMRSPSAWYKHR